MASNYANYLGARRCCDLRGLGPQGAQGSIGAYGPIGPIGSQGSTGAIGATGSQGTQGSQGPAGTAGKDSAYGGFNIGAPINYTLNNSIQCQMVSDAPINLGESYAIHVSVFISGLTTNLPAGPQQYNISCNIQPNPQIAAYIYPAVFSNPATSSVPLPATRPCYCSFYTVGSLTQMSASFSDFFTYNNSTIIAFNPFNVNVFLGNTAASAGTVYTGSTIVVSVTINPVNQ